MSTPIPHAIELHDSCLSAVECGVDGVVVHLAPAYVHRDGKGWLQEARLLFGSGQLRTAADGIPGMVSDGHVVTPGGRIDNLIPIPFRAAGPVSLCVVLRTGQHIVVTGDSVRVEVSGEPRFVEDTW